LELIIRLPTLVSLHVDALSSTAPSRWVQGLHLPLLP
ncbi:hypothetical protein N300_15420, partial [Calypte anna]